MHPSPVYRNGGYALPLLALLLVGLLACIWELHRINGEALPLELSQAQGQELIADVMPPPLLIVESYASLLSVQGYAKDSAALHGLAQSLRKQRQLEYERRYLYWKAHAPHALLDSSHREAQAFFSIALNEYIPARLLGRDSLARALFEGGLSPAYEAHRGHVERLVQSLKASNAAIAAELESKASYRRLLLRGAMLLLLANMGIAAYMLYMQRQHALGVHRQLEKLSLTDALTGLGNRRYFEKRIGQDLLRARRQFHYHGRGLGLLLLDIDHFKRINDTYGHDCGDRVLKEFASRISRVLRGDDSLVRWGGEEFLLIVNDCDQERLRALSSRLLNAVRREPFELEGASLTVTCSTGACLYTEKGSGLQGESWQDLVKLADQALYAAKNQGRDRALCAGRVYGVYEEL